MPSQRHYSHNALFQEHDLMLTFTIASALRTTKGNGDAYTTTNSHCSKILCSEESKLQGLFDLGQITDFFSPSFLPLIKLSKNSTSSKELF